MFEQKNINRALFVLFALIPCVIYNVSSIQQYIALPKYMTLSPSPILQAIGSIVLLIGLSVGFISILWERTQREHASKSSLVQAIIFRSFMLIPMILLTFCHLNLNGNSLFFDVKDSRNFVLVPIRYLLDGTVFAALFLNMKKSRLMILPLFVIYIVVLRLAVQGLGYYIILIYSPPYCQNAAPDSVAYKVCEFLGPDVPKLVQGASGFYTTYWGLSEVIVLPEEGFSGSPCTAETIISVAQHELGHKKYHHMIILSLVDMIGELMPVVGAQIFLDFPTFFAAVSGRSLDVVPIVVYSMSEVTNSILGSYFKPLKLALSRHFEFQADSNVEAPYVDPLSQFLKDRFDDSMINQFYRALRCHHPATDERIARMKARVQA